MTVYGRSDIMSVAVSQHHGGCGAVHSRPVTHGSPVKIWALSCHPCEDYLRSDPHWVTDTEEIPETPDEVRVREQMEKKGESRRLATQEELITRLASSQEGTQKLMTMFAAALAGSNPEMAKMLASLAAAPTMSTETVAKAAEQEVLAATPDGINAQRTELGLEPFLFDDGLTVLKQAAQEMPDLSKLQLKDLRALAKSRSLDSTGNRDQLIARLNDTEG